MEKKVRNAVKTFVISDDKVVCIKYKQGPVGFIDIPGGKIEKNETAEEAAVREFKEETGLNISNLIKIGTMITEYPDRIYHLILFIAKEFKGSLKNFEENDSFYIPIGELLREEKRFAVTYLLNNYKEFNKKEIHVKYIVNENNQILKIEEI